MAFRYDAKADSSDDSAPDFSTWQENNLKIGSASKPHAPRAISVGSSVSASEDSASEVEAVPARPPGSQPAPAARQSFGFQSINTPTQTTSQSEEESELQKTPARLRRGESRNVASQEEMALFVGIRRSEVDTSDYEDFTGGSNRVRRVLGVAQDDYEDEIVYRVIFDNYYVDQIAISELRTLANGREALKAWKENPTTIDLEPSSKRARRSNAPRMTSTRPGSSRTITGFVSTVDYVTDSDESPSDDNNRRSARTRKRKQAELTQYTGEDDEDEEGSDDDIALVGSDEDDSAGPSRRGRKPRGAKARASRRGPDDDDDDGDIFGSDIRGPKKRKRQHPEPSRHSARTTRHVGAMQEVEIDDIYRSSSDEPRGPAKPKPTSTRETFKPLPRNDEFRMRHNQFCNVCNQTSVVGPLIDCQGCSLAYHKSCLGHRTSREHLATKIGEDEFVLQCRRCIAFPRKKDAMAPDQGKCQECREHGPSCRPFRRRTTPAQEQKAREENDGVDPIYPVDPMRINNADNVLFRCLQCYRGFHYNHLPSRSGMMELEMEVDAEQRFREYSRDWKCRDCVDAPAKVSGIIAWKPIDEDAYDPNTGLDGIEEDEVVYLVRWEGMSYFRARWMPGAWVWGVTSASMRKAFAKREGAQHPKMRLEDAIPEDYLRTDIVLDIKYTSIVDIHTEEIDKARIREVEKALIKYKGLGYEDAVWEAPPTPDDGERWSDFVMAYNDLVAGRYIRQPKGSALKARLEKARNQDFATLEKKTQPDNLEGGKLMDYQIEGLNWLYYKWHTRSNAILADEMGLGKTIQIIGFIATMVQDWNCYPFLVVVPNSTCPNWRREIKRWAPSLRVVAYYGSKESRDLASRYELYPEGSKDLRCHIVVTSYDAAADDNCRRFFRGVSWQGLIVDEGQRLKNDKNLLYSALEALKAPFKILLTGTPLQNNQRELFNLLHFLDDTFDAEALEAEYEDLDPQKVAKLHDMIRPFFLRRTKVQVLTFLPPMAQIIVPVSMTIVQKKLYKSILAKNPDLMRAIFSAESTSAKGSEKAGLNNILMQLRKCLCHPFVYNRSIEDKNVSIAASHRNLVDASSKLKLLELLLPKLKERGHRVLIFSQFLDMLDMVEDFLDGMELRYQRLDGSITSLQKQKRIDEFNAEGSLLFAFLLSTRAGGVGINLATADTVIILDPDFNPHQDIQALARAHRIGQKKKVLCFQLVTRASAEERIMQIGRKKLALEHVLIRQMDNTEEGADETDITSVLRHGVTELFEGNGEQDITYDTSSIERLLDRSHMEDTKSGEAQSAENQFSFARVWANDQGALTEADLGTENEAPDPGVWANILRERERIAAEEAAANAEALGRGRRARQNVDYAGDLPKGPDDVHDTPAKRRGKREGDGSDTDFQAGESEADDDLEGEGENGVIGNDEVFGLGPRPSPAKPKKPDIPTFRRAVVPRPEANPSAAAPYPPPAVFNCRACHTLHEPGSCPLKLAGVEYCNLCGIAHYGHARVCPHIQSETQVRAMLEALRYSTEPEHLVNEARRYLRGLKGNLVQLKKQQELKRAEQEAMHAAATMYHPQASMMPEWYRGPV